MQPVSHLYHHPSKLMPLSFTRTLTLRAVPPMWASPYHDWAPEPHVNTLHGNCPFPAQAPTSVLWVHRHQNAHDLKTCMLTLFMGLSSSFILSGLWHLESGLAYPILSKWMCFCSGTQDRWCCFVGTLSCLSYDSWGQAVPIRHGCTSHPAQVLTSSRRLSLVGIGLLFPDAHQRYCTSLPWIPFHPIQAVTLCRLFISLMPFSTPLGFPCAGLSLLWTSSSLCWGSDTLTQITVIHHSHCNTAFDHYGYSPTPICSNVCFVLSTHVFELNYQEGGKKRKKGEKS